jgi:hypothetical protein
MTANLPVENPGFTIPITTNLSGQIESIQAHADKTIVNLIFIGERFDSNNWWEVRLRTQSGELVKPVMKGETTSRSSDGITEFTSAFEPLPPGESVSVQLAVVPLARTSELDSSGHHWNEIHVIPAS